MFLKRRPQYSLVLLMFMTCSVCLAEAWYEDAPYVKIREQYESLLKNVPKAGDTSNLAVEMDLAIKLITDYYPGWTDMRVRQGKGIDQFEKGRKLLEHVVAYYPPKEYRVLMAKCYLAGFLYHTNRDREALETYIDIFSVPTETVVDCTREDRNKPISETDTKTPAQKDFEVFIKNFLRNRVVEIASKSFISVIDKMVFLGQIETQCKLSDPSIAQLARQTIITASCEENPDELEMLRKDVVGK